MFLGTFLSDPVNIAVGVIGYMASQLLLALLAQALGLTMEAIRGGRQVAVMTIFGQSGFQLADSFAQLRHLFSQDCILFSELFQLFVFAHASTLLVCSLLCKPLGLLDSYIYFYISIY